MKLIRFGSVGALLAATALVGCSADNSSAPQGEHGSSIGFRLQTTGGVVITSASYDLALQSGADVVNGTVPVPNDDSVISLGIRSLAPGAYSLVFSATGMYNGTPVPCTAPASLFPLAANQELVLPAITLTCNLTNQVDNTGSVDANVTVAVGTINVNGVVETFTYGPRSVIGHLDLSGSCNYPPVALKIASHDASIHYSWASSSDGAFSFTDATNTVGTYMCQTGGDKTITLTGNNGSITSQKTFVVHCDDSVCLSGAVCGDTVVQTGEQCDPVTPEARCVNCQIHPVCGDGVTDAPEQCDTAGASATCDINCHIIVPTFCGDGIVNNGEQCDAGDSAHGGGNSDTAANACRTNCHTASCGDGVADSGEACDQGGANSDTTPNTCRTSCQAPSCGDGVVDTGEQCDATMLPTASCDTACHSIVAAKHTACEACLALDDYDGTVQSGCDGNTQCRAVEDCTIDANCFSPIPAVCYCGIADATACKADSFHPTGACKSEIAAGAGGFAIAADGSVPSGASASILQRYFNTAFATGVAMNLINDAATSDGEAAQCQSTCF